MNKYIKTTHFEGTIKEWYTMENAAAYMLYFKDDFKVLNKNITTLFANPLTNEKIIQVGIAYFEKELREQLKPMEIVINEQVEEQERK